MEMSAQMPLWQMLVLIGVMALGTLLLRTAPFLLFPAHKPTPRFVLFLGRYLPFAIMGFLIVYCLKSVSVTAYPFGLPEAIAVVFVAALHLWRKNTLLSIGAGTILYMVLVQAMFR